MRWIVPSLICAAALAAGCEAPEIEGNGLLAEEVRDSEPFTRLVVSDGIDVKVTVRPELRDELLADHTRYMQVVVRTDENLLEHVDVYVYGDELIVEAREDVVPTAGIEVQVEAWVLEAMKLREGSTAHVTGLYGQGFEVWMDGGSVATVAGETDLLLVDAGGDVVFRGFDLQSTDARVLARGNTRVEVCVSGELDVLAERGSHVTYDCGATIDENEVRDSSTLQPRE